MDRNCDAFIRSNNTYDILIARESLEISDDRAECIQNIGEKFVAEYFDRDEVPQLSIKTYGYSIIPKCFGLLDTLALETTGILQLQNQPALSLRGQGIFIGFVDTGISYELPCFRNADGSTRIRSIWDQSIPTGEKNTPQGFLYGTEYTQKEINEALEQEHPRELVPVTDEDGHGTMLASIACGSEDLQAGFTGAAPYAELLVVKLKPAKPYLKDFFYIPQEMPAYQENDIMAAIEYLEETARKLGRPLILCLGLGTNNGSHSGGSNLSELLDDKLSGLELIVKPTEEWNSKQLEAAKYCTGVTFTVRIRLSPSRYPSLIIWTIFSGYAPEVTKEDGMNSLFALFKEVGTGAWIGNRGAGRSICVLLELFISIEKETGSLGTMKRRIR